MPAQLGTDGDPMPRRQEEICTHAPVTWLAWCTGDLGQVHGRAPEVGR